MRALVRHCLLAFILSAGVVLPAAPCSAQSYKVNDPIEVFHLNDWKPATVVNTNQRGEVLAEYEFAGRPHRDVFKPEAVRAAYESGAIARGRVWSAAAGSFSVKAALLSANDKEVKLRKTDMTELTVAVDKLSEADKTYLRKLQKSLGPAGEQGPTPPPAEAFASGSGLISSVSWESTSGRPAISPDPVPTYMRLKQGGCGFPTEDFFDRLSAVLPVGASDQWLLAAVENGTPGKPLPSRLLWVSLARQKVDRRQLLPPSEKLLDYHAGSHRVLTFNEIEKDSPGGRGRPVLTIWETTPTAKEVKPIVRWYSDGDYHQWGSPWARLIDGNLVVERAEKQRYVVWDISAKQAKYSVTQESFFAPEAVLSGGRKQLFLPEDKGVRVLESATGKWLTTLPANHGSSGVAISEDGKQAAVLDRTSLTVWDLTTADAPAKNYQAEAIGTPFTSDIFWVGNDRIVADDKHTQRLFSLKNNLTLWRYDFDHNAVSEHWGGRVREIIDGHLVYAATFNVAAQRGLAVGAVQLPGPRVDETEAKLDKETLYIVKPGTEVRVEANVGEFTSRVQKALEDKVIANGWTLSPNATAVLSAEMKLGEQQTVNYRMFGIGATGSTQSATFTPHIATLTLKVGEKTAWQSGTSSGAPPIVRLRRDEAVQGEVDKWQKDHPEFFESVGIPPRILDPKYRDGLGTTLVTNRGLISKN
jgi:SLA1 homology domain 1, SHD1